VVGYYLLVSGLDSQRSRGPAGDRVFDATSAAVLSTVLEQAVRCDHHRHARAGR
jgi:hypothetical protein